MFIITIVDLNRMGIDVIVTRAGLEYSATKTSTNVS